MANRDPDRQARELAKAELALEKLEQENSSLRHCLNRLSIVSNNVDPAIDPDLDELRRQIKKEAAASSLSRIVDRIAHNMSNNEVSDSPQGEQQNILRQLSDEFTQLGLFCSNENHKLSALLDKQADLSYVFTRFIEILKKSLSERLSNAPHQSSEPASKAYTEEATDNSDAPGRDTISAEQPLQPETDVITHTSQPNDVTSPSSIALGSAADGDFCHTNFNAALKTLFEVVEVPEHLQEDKQAIFESLNQPIRYSELEGVIKTISAFIIRVHQLERDKFHHFIDGLNRRFLDVENFLKHSVDQNQDRTQQAHNLGLQVNHRLDHLQDQYRVMDDLNALVALLDEGFDAIRLNIESYQQVEQQKSELLEAEVITLKHKLSETEQYALDLQSSLLLFNEQAQKDSLTGLFNRDAYENQLDNRLHRVKLLNQPLVMAVADIDNFKSINDTYGHLSGDAVLKQVAEMLGDKVKNDDFVARYGGEEFVIVLNNIDYSAAETVLDRIRQYISEQVFTLKSKKVSITVSFGFTMVSVEDSKESAFSRADDALYLAKSGGRNRVIGK